MSISLSANAHKDIVLSVIVPVYNVERYLRRCLDSLLRQDVEVVGGYEIICVNDGSPDNSAAILAEYEERHPDIIRVITQENQGQGVARNTGMAVARGEYIAFCDSDDYVTPGGYRQVLDCFYGKKNADLVRFRYNMVHTDPATLDTNATGEASEPEARERCGNAAAACRITFEGDGVYIYNRNDPFVSFMSPWRSFYRRDFLTRHQITFEAIIHEDEHFNFQVYRQHPRALDTDFLIYQYEQGNVQSIMTTRNEQRLWKMLNDEVNLMGVFNDYLAQPDAELAPGVRMLVNALIDAVLNRLCCTRFSHRQWKSLNERLKAMPIHTLMHKPGESRVARVLKNMKNAAAHTYFEYRVVNMFYLHLFIPIIRPILVRE